MTGEDWVRGFCIKVGKELASDLYQELFLILCEKPESWIVEKYESGYWAGFVSRIILNQFYGKRTSFEKNFLRPIGMEDTSQVEIAHEDEPYTEHHQEAIDAVLEKCDWYESRIWELWSKGDDNIRPRSARAIARVTDISRQEILRVVNELKIKINDEYLVRNNRSQLSLHDICLRDRLEGED